MTIFKYISISKYRWYYNLTNNTKNVNLTLYKEMLDVELESILFSVLMGLNENNIKVNSNNYKLKLYNDYLKKVGASNE